MIPLDYRRLRPKLKPSWRLDQRRAEWVFGIAFVVVLVLIIYTITMGGWRR